MERRCPRKWTSTANATSATFDTDARGRRCGVFQVRHVPRTRGTREAECGGSVRTWHRPRRPGREKNSMQFHPLGDPNEDGHPDDLTQIRICNLKERLAERLRTTALVRSGDIPWVRWNDHTTGCSPSGLLDRLPCVRWNDGSSYDLGHESERRSVIAQRLRIFLKTRRYEEFHDELARAEVSREMPEFYVLNFRDRRESSGLRFAARQPLCGRRALSGHSLRRLSNRRSVDQPADRALPPR
jgi:hypothetical protein